MYKIGLSTCNNVTEEFFKQCKIAGIEVVEISASKENCDALNYNEVLSWSKKYSLKISSFHLPFAPFTEIDISNEKLSGKTIEYLSDIITKATDIGINKFIIHPSGEPIDDNDRNARLNTAKESLNKLAEFVYSKGGVLAVENLPRTCLGKNSTEINELLSANSKLKACFDTNHLLAENPVDFINAVGNKIITTHVSDYDFINERHWLPGEGKTNWQSILTALNNVKYNGPWLYEVSLEVPKNIIRSRNLTPADFVKNANEIFNNRPISVFSTPKKDLGFW